MHRVDWLRDVRGIDYFDRLSHMITEWSELGMVLPVEDQPESLRLPELRIEQGRIVRKNPDDVITQKQYQLVEKVEDLFQPSTAAQKDRVAGLAAVEVSKRVYRPGTI
jgi:hypothetical protein